MADLTITASQVQPGTTDASFDFGTAGATITAGQSVYLDATTSTYKLADNDLSAAAAAGVGVALNGASSGQPLKVQKGGTVTVGAAAAPTVGIIYCVSATAGGICPSADLVSTNRVTILGVGGATNTIILKVFASAQVKP